MRARHVLLALVLATTAFTSTSTSGLAGEPGTLAEEHVSLLVPLDGDWHRVELQALLAERPGAAAEARREIFARFPGAIELEAGSGEVLAQSVQSGYRWESGGVAWGYNPAGAPAGLAGAFEAIAAAAATWSSAGAAFGFAGGELTTASPGGCTTGGKDGRNSIAWGSASGATLALTCTWFADDGGGTFKRATEFDVEIDRGWGWTTGDAPEVDLQSVLTHEFGHALGLGHTNSSSCPRPVMCGRYEIGTFRRTLHSDDEEGLLAVYGPAPAEVAPAVPAWRANARRQASLPGLARD